MQEEHLSIIKTDASSRFAGALKVDAIPPFGGMPTRQNFEYYVTGLKGHFTLEDISSEKSNKTETRDQLTMIFPKLNIDQLCWTNVKLSDNS